MFYCRVDVVNHMVNANKNLWKNRVQDQKLVLKRKQTQKTIVQQNALAAH